METQGYRVLRFTTLQVLGDVNVVIDTIAAALHRRG
jgi:very-short-patch-repair endonuclease